MTFLTKDFYSESLPLLRPSLPRGIHTPFVTEQTRFRKQYEGAAHARSLVLLQRNYFVNQLQPLVAPQLAQT